MSETIEAAAIADMVAIACEKPSPEVDALRRIAALEARCEDMQRQITHLLGLALAHPRISTPVRLCNCPPGSVCGNVACPYLPRIT